MSKNISRGLSFFINTLTSSSYIKVISKDIFVPLKKRKIYSDKMHLDATLEWLRRSQDASEDTGGCAGIYSFEKRWHSPYPETTGYIISTFLEYAKLGGDQIFAERAKKLGNWEINIQLPSGGVRGGVGINAYPIVFNTGQVMLGWLSLYQFSGDETYLSAAKKAGDWLVKIQDADGKWSKYTYNEIPHAYNIRVTWALFQLYDITKKELYKEAAEKNLRWVLSQKKENGWINFMGFTLTEEPLTHTIAYTLRGLLECSFYVSEEKKNKILVIIQAASEAIIRKYNDYVRPFMPGTFNDKWDTYSTYSCLTGNAQLAIIWLKYFLITGNDQFLQYAFSLIDQIKATQDLKSNNPGIRGGIAGSFPIWGKYVSFGYPNWAAKFFADSLMLKMKLPPMK